MSSRERFSEQNLLKAEVRLSVEGKEVAGRRPKEADLDRQEVTIGGERSFLGLMTLEEWGPSLPGSSPERCIVDHLLPVAKALTVYYEVPLELGRVSYRSVRIESLVERKSWKVVAYFLETAHWGRLENFGASEKGSKVGEELVWTTSPHRGIVTDESAVKLANQVIAAVTYGPEALRELFGSDLEWCSR